MPMTKNKQPPRPRYVCIRCGTTFAKYDDARGGDIGKSICRKCSCNSNLDVDRRIPKEMKRYVEEVCPYYEDRKYVNGRKCEGKSAPLWNPKKVGVAIAKRLGVYAV